ncbi:SU10 major capsid protein [Roseomonas sp. WA12]
MPGFSSYDVVGAKESVSDIITTLTPTKTPFQSMIGSSKIKSRLHQWQEDALADVADNAKVEGFTAANDTHSPTTMRDNTTQILSKTVEITGSMDAVDVYGSAKESARAMRKKSQEIKRDLENAFVGTGQTKVAGSSSVARKMAGVQAQISAAATTAAAGAVLTEALFMTGMQKLYNLGSEPSVLMVKPTDAPRIAAFASAAGRTRDVGASKTITNAVDVLVTPFGTVRVSLNRQIRKSDALLVDPDHWEKLVLRDWFRETLAKTGDSIRMMIVGEFSLKHDHVDATGLISGLDIT